MDAACLLVLLVLSMWLVLVKVVAATVLNVALQVCAPAVLAPSCWRMMRVWRLARLVTSNQVVNACLVTRTVENVR